MIQELQVSPMGIISGIYPKNNDTDSRLGINILQQVRRGLRCRGSGPRSGDGGLGVYVDGACPHAACRRQGVACPSPALHRLGAGAPLLP